jgi:DNA replication and repair protein RecF
VASYTLPVFGKQLAFRAFLAYKSGMTFSLPLALRKMNISQFRCYEAVRLDLADSSGLVVLTGPNGAGKTNILEAVSLLVPGKGLRSADILEMKNRAAGPEDVWAISAEVDTPSGLTVRIGTGLDREVKRRVIRINGKNAKSQNELSGFISAVWLTPQMDRLFLEGASARRKFLDRLVYAFEPEHVTRVNRYDKAMRERMKLLLLDRHDASWLQSLEAQMAAEAVSIAASRLALTEHLQQQVAALGRVVPLFPQPHLALQGWTENEVAARPAVDVEDELKKKIAAARAQDRAAGRTHEGIHRSDLLVSYAEKNMPADQSSTGEQKALLVSIILAHALMMKAEKGYVPIILLDEVAAHLDEARRKQLFDQLSALGGQIWLTGTDEAVFAQLTKAKFFHVDKGHVAPAPLLRDMAL